MTAVTFDVDFTDYTSADGAMLDEMDASFGAIKAELQRWPTLRTTWFVRLDAHIGERYGRRDYILAKHASSFDWLRSRGHEISWHHHAFIHGDGAWRPSGDPADVSAQLRASNDLAREHGLLSTRMGWGFHTNETMRTLEELGWTVDSSALPRPAYPWDSLDRDWSITPRRPYRPSVSDYRVPGTPARALLEVPMTTVPLSAPGDSQPDVMRYINPAYRPAVFADAVERVEAGEDPVLICHPYELVASDSSHPLLAFDIAAFRANVEHLVARGDSFATISEHAANLAADMTESS